MNSLNPSFLQDATRKFISLNNYSAECIENNQTSSYEESISYLSKVYNLLMVLEESKNSEEKELDSSSTSSSTSTSTQPEMPQKQQQQQQQQQQHLFDIDPLVKIPKSTTDPTTGTQEMMKMYRHPIRIPSLFAECTNPNGGLVDGLVKVGVIFNVALSYHLAANTDQQSDGQQQEQQQHKLLLLRKAYELYQLCLKIQPTCVHSKKSIFQLVILNNMACICNDLDEKTKRNVHLNDIVSIVVYMTSNPYNKLNHPSSTTMYESFFASSVRLLMIGDDDDDGNDNNRSSTTNNTILYYSAVA